MQVKFEYDLKRKEVKIISDNFNQIKEYFSVKNPGARFVRGGRFMPQRIYAITPSGYCGVGLIPEIVKYLKTLSVPYEIAFDQELTRLYNNLKFQIPTSYPNIKGLFSEYQLRDYQK